MTEAVKAAEEAPNLCQKDEMDIILARAIDRVFEAGGGPGVLAEKLGITRTGISMWRKRIPSRHLYRLQAITGIPPEEMRPDVFQPPLVEQQRPRKPFKSREVRLREEKVLRRVVR